MSKNSKFEEKGFEYGISKRVNGLLKKKPITLIENSIKLKMHNHLQCNFFLGNKKALFYSIKKYYELLKINPFTKIPLTFHVKEGLEDPEFERFL
jgi:tubulin--tyrosine ligase